MIIVRNVPKALFIALLAVTLSFAQSDKDFRIDDDSDWWSIIRENATDEVLKPEHQDVDQSNSRSSASQSAATIWKPYSESLERLMS